MKRLILLISLCLLSQNYTIANENGEAHYGISTPLSQNNDSENFLRTQNSYSNSLLKQNSDQKTDDNLNKSELRFPGLKLPIQQAEENSSNLNPEVKKAEETASKTSEAEEIKEDSSIQNAKTEETTVSEEKIIDTTCSSTTAPEQNIQKEQNKEISQDKQEAKVKDTVSESTTEETIKDTEQQVSNEEKPAVLDAMEILRAQTKAPIKPVSQKIKPIPQKISQKYKINITKEDSQNSSVKPKTQNDEKPTVVITQIVFPESKIFSEEELRDLVSPILNRPVTIEEIQKVVSDISRCYTLGDYPTAKAYLPPQTITNGVLKIGLLEGTIGKINVEGNRWVKTKYFKKRIANQKEGELLNIDELEKDIVRFNNNNTAKVRASLNSGENPGETDITLNVTEKFPFKLSVMTDNQGRKSIGTGRFGSMINTDSLFGMGDRFALGGYLGRGNRIGFTDYNIPVGKYGTRIGASAAAGNISVVNGIMRQFDVGGTTQNYSVYVTQPIYDAEGTSISSYTSANFKKSTSDIMDYKFYDKSTFSVTQGFNFRKDTDRGIWYTGHYGSVGFKALSGDEDFFKYEGNITRLHDFGKGIIGQFRVSGQYSPNHDLPWMEQFQIGGMSTVRGYSEALLLGKSGYFASAEIMTPIPILPKRIGSDRLGYIYPRDMIKGAVFMDNGMIYPYKEGDCIDSGDLLMSWGFGLRVNLKEDLAARFYWGYGLHNKYDNDKKMGRFHFDITCAPDIGKLVSTRKPSSKVKKEKKQRKHQNTQEDL